jgi:hypothetical protein
MLSVNGLKAPPPPAIDTFAVAIGLQPGCGFGLGEGLGVWPRISVAPRVRKIALRAMTIHWSGRFTSRACGDFAASLCLNMVVMISSWFVLLEGNRTGFKQGLETDGNAVVTWIS